MRQSGSMRNGAYASRPNGGGSDMFFRTSGCSRICPCARICCSGGGSGAVRGIVRRRGSAFGSGTAVAPHAFRSIRRGKTTCRRGARLLACPELLLMDEPLTGLDRGKREEIMAYVKAIPERFGVPILYVTHSDAERRFLADRVLNLEDGKLTEY